MFLSYKKKAEYKLVFKLRIIKKIMILSKLFERSNAIKINGLIIASVIQLVKYELNDAYCGI